MQDANVLFTMLKKLMFGVERKLRLANVVFCVIYYYMTAEEMSDKDIYINNEWSDNVEVKGD